MKEIVFVFIGGGIGSVLRFGISLIWQHLTCYPRFASIVFPWPTFVANILGCLLISIFYTQSDRWGLTSEMRLLLTTGLCGGFTTFSTFSYESVRLLRSGMYSMFGIYVSLSIAIGLIVIVIFIPLIKITH